jgi:hypothetical protein
MRLKLYEELCLNDNPTIHQAIAAFEKRMCPRNSAITDETLRNTELMDAADGLENCWLYLAKSSKISSAL